MAHGTAMKRWIAVEMAAEIAVWKEEERARGLARASLKTGHYTGRSLCYGIGRMSQKIKESRSTIAPVWTGMGCRKIGPAKTKV